MVGPESTGKTTLARHLAAAYGAPWSAEGARAYAEARLAHGNRQPLGAGDVGPIAHAQVALEDAAAEAAEAAGAPLVVRDTDLVSTVVYARHHYGACPAWVEWAARARRAALYLLCDVDLAWAPDPVRDARSADPAERTRVREAFRTTLAEFGCRYVEVRGDGAARERAARDAVDTLLSERSERRPAPSPSL